MNEFKKSQLVVLIILVLLLLITHFLPSSLRPAFLYFIFNLLIISLGAEAGLLSAFPKPLQDKTQSSHTQKPHETIHEERDASIPEHNEKKLSVTKGEKVKKCASSSKPSLFFMGTEETDEAEETIDEEEGEAEEEEGGGVNGQEELCAKAEAFIGNFYKQLKMQRGVLEEDS